MTDYTQLREDIQQLVDDGLYFPPFGNEGILALIDRILELEEEHNV